MKTSKSLLFVFLLILFSNYAFANPLDRTGTGMAPNKPDYYTCTQVKLGKNGAGGTEPFTITMTGVCAVHPGQGLPGWTPLSWREVSVYGRYHYSSQVAKETVRVQGQDVFQVDLSCSKNPWAHGVWVGGATCSAIGEPVNKTGAVVDGPYPLSARFMDYSTQSAIAKGEETGFKSAEELAEELLGDWNPYEQTGGESALVIKKPGNFELIDQNISYYDFVMENKPGFQELSYIKYEFEHLEETPDLVGDIDIPDTYTHWWQPFWKNSLPASISPVPIGISNGLFANKPGQYRFRVRGSQGSPQMNTIGGWSSWRNFCIGQPGAICGNSNLVEVGKKTEVLKKMQAINLVFNQRLKGSKANQLKKKQDIFAQLDSKTFKHLKHKETGQKPPGLSKKKTTSLTLLSSKPSYRANETAVFMLKGDADKQPVVECFDKKRWGSKCPQGIKLRKMGSGAQTRYILSASKAGKYRLRVGNILSDDIEIKPVKSAKLKAKKTPKIAPKPKKKVIIAKEPKKKKKVASLVPKAAPQIRINKKTFTTPAAVKLTLKAASKFKVRYILEQEFGKDRYRKVQTLRSLSFNVTTPGQYRVKAKYEGGQSESFVYFTVKPKIMKKIQKQPLKKIEPKPPLVPKKRIIQIQ